MTTRYLDPKNDLAFKKVFGAEKHKRIPIDFLNAVFHLEKEDKIIDLEFLNPKQAPEINEAYTILDRFHWTENELQWYEKLIMNTADAKGMLDAARNEGRLEIVKKMLESGLSIQGFLLKKI